ncbi:LysR family transcriptional regulator [Alcanivorax hongdengensis A-11-3]|uniref:LysR family transcriptional regulator n=1 Tax=Alcanivorax hongdengensis A-11-3 TaxID=1177179 RepID=L0WFE2_9GAMM|nr:LysR substrate-binding domain-containing protein [Alcanivorax hongdengensis]EKF75568.1 LysR family transcriptional regulator [Alcanivorax hongdengensis A-11-3]
MKLNLRSVDLNLLPVFNAIMEAGQLSRAAEALGMSQPAISAALQRLRHTLGDELFVRTRQGMQPTPRALELHPLIREHLDGLRDVLDPGNRFNPATSERHFRLLSVDYFEMVVLPGLLKRLRERAPHIVLEVTVADDRMGDALHKAEADLAIDAFIPEDPKLARQVLLAEPLVVIARQGHPVLRGKCSKQAFLEAEHVVLPDRNRRLPLDQILQEPGWQRRTGVRVTQFSSMLAACSHSDMIATVPRRLAQQYGPAMGLQILPFPADLPPVPIFMLWSPAQERDPAHQWLRELLMEEAAQHP